MEMYNIPTYHLGVFKNLTIFYEREKTQPIYLGTCTILVSKIHKQKAVHNPYGNSVNLCKLWADE